MKCILAPSWQLLLVRYHVPHGLTTLIILYEYDPELLVMIQKPSSTLLRRPPRGGGRHKSRSRRRRVRLGRPPGHPTARATSCGTPRAPDGRYLGMPSPLPPPCLLSSASDHTSPHQDCSTAVTSVIPVKVIDVSGQFCCQVRRHRLNHQHHHPQLQPIAASTTAMTSTPQTWKIPLTPEEAPISPSRPRRRLPCTPLSPPPTSSTFYPPPSSSLSCFRSRRSNPWTSSEIVPVNILGVG